VGLLTSTGPACLHRAPYCAQIGGRVDGPGEGPSWVWIGGEGKDFRQYGNTIWPGQGLSRLVEGLDRFGKNLGKFSSVNEQVGYQAKQKCYL
jgi:hypothetical protein